MPVQHVELVHGHRVEHVLDRCHVVEVARHIQMLAAPAETRPVADGHRRYLDIALARIRGHQLPCAHGAVEQPGAITRLDTDALRVAIQAIAFLLRYRCLRAAFQADAARRCAGFVAHFQRQAARALEQVGEIFGAAACIGIATDDRNHRAGTDVETATAAGDLRRGRNQGQRCVGGRCRGGAGTGNGRCGAGLALTTSKQGADCNAADKQARRQSCGQQHARRQRAWNRAGVGEHAITSRCGNQRVSCSLPRARTRQPRTVAKPWRTTQGLAHASCARRPVAWRAQRCATGSSSHTFGSSAPSTQQLKPSRPYCFTMS